MSLDIFALGLVILVIVALIVMVMTDQREGGNKDDR
jgi:hypothetical protein